MPATLTFIGHINTPYTAIEDCPNNIQPGGAICRLNLLPQYQHELAGLCEGQNILILYWLGHGDRTEPEPEPESDTTSDKPGIFALRTPLRPNPIGAAVLPIEEIAAGHITVRGLDCLNNSELLDIKPAIYAEGS